MSTVHIPVEKPAYMPQRTFDQLKQKATELEGVFLTTLMSQVTSSANAQGQFGGGHAEETWRGMMATEQANEMAKAGGIGLSDSILRDLLSTQAASRSNQFHPVSSSGAYQK